jgi:hypothetical protein
MEKPYKYDDWKASLDKENPARDALDSYASVVEQFLKDPSGNNTKSVLLNAKQYTDYFLYESNLEEACI